MSDAITVRMYNVGFGDAFLVFLPTPSGRRKVLVDCGSVSSDPNHPMDDVVDRIIQDVTDQDGVARLDVVIATHRHKDHVSGFANAAWRAVEVQEVWLPWTEDPTDPKAREIRDVQSRLAASLQAALGFLPAGHEVSLIGGLAANALSNEKAMETLHRGFANPVGRKPRFLPESQRDASGQPTGKLLRTVDSPALPGVVVHVLGPSRDPEVIRDMDPPAGRSYLRFPGAVDPATGAARAEAPWPFSPDWAIESEESEQPGPYTHLRLNPGDRDFLRRSGQGLETAIAVALDKAVNGTSLMLVFQVGDKCLLFPGDAQWGTWQAALADPEWRRLLQRTDFYKVGHHGSHNATPMQFIEEVLPQERVAMTSVRPTSTWPCIPKQELLDALARRRTQMARSDQLGAASALTFQANGDLYVETTLPVN